MNLRRFTLPQIGSWPKLRLDRRPSDSSKEGLQSPGWVKITEKSSFSVLMKPSTKRWAKSLNCIVKPTFGPVRSKLSTPAAKLFASPRWENLSLRKHPKTFTGSIKLQKGTTVGSHSTTHLRSMLLCSNTKIGTHFASLLWPIRIFTLEKSGTLFLGWPIWTLVLEFFPSAGTRSYLITQRPQCLRKSKRRDGSGSLLGLWFMRSPTCSV